MNRGRKSLGRFEREGLLWEGCEFHGKAAGTASLYFKLKGNSKYRPLAQSDELSVTSFPRPRSVFVLNRVLRSSSAVVSFALSSFRDLFLSVDTVSSLLFQRYLNFSNWNCFRYSGECSRKKGASQCTCTIYLPFCENFMQLWDPRASSTARF